MEHSKLRQIPSETLSPISGPTSPTFAYPVSVKESKAPDAQLKASHPPHAACSPSSAGQRAALAHWKAELTRLRALLAGSFDQAFNDMDYGGAAAACDGLAEVQEQVDEAAEMVRVLESAGVRESGVGGNMKRQDSDKATGQNEGGAMEMVRVVRPDAQAAS